MTDDIKQICNNLVELASIDYVGFWEVVSKVSEIVKTENHEEKARLTLEVVLCMLAARLKVFNFREGTAERIFWNEESTNEIVARIAREWLAHGEKVGLGDVCWFTVR